MSRPCCKSEPVSRCPISRTCCHHCWGKRVRALIDASAEVRAERLRRIAAVEITRHREAQGFLGAALEGSLATDAVWPTSDLDFTIVPCPDASKEHLIEW